MDSHLLNSPVKTSCLIADEMGLGKTLQALSVAYYYRHKWPLLIVVPASLKYPWVEEVEKWFPEIDPAAINMINNGSDIGGISTSEVTILSYGLLNRPSCKVVQEALVNQQFDFIIIDESHYMKNGKTQTTKYLVPLLQKAEHKILLTGTPALSRPIELFSQLDALQEGMFGSYWQFARKYCDGKFLRFGGKKRWYCEGASNLEDLQHRLTQDVMIRRLKKDVLTQLPAKQRQKIPFELKDSKLKSEVDRINQELGSELEKFHLSMSDVLRQKEECTAVGDPFKIRNLMSQMYRETAKVKIGPVREYVKMLCENRGLKFLVFAYHHNMMDGIAEELHDTNVKYIRIDGQTATQERPALVHQFQQDPETRVGILSIKAAGVGLTLTAARIVIFAELDWTPGSLEQCEDRAHRIGQKETVHIHYLVAKGTLDEYVWSMLSRKTTVVTTTLNGVTQTLQMEEGNRGQIDRLSKADVYIPSEKAEDVSLSQLFNCSQSTSQKSLLEYFTPTSKSSERKAVLTKDKKKKAVTGNISDALNDSGDTLPDIVVIDDSPEKITGKRKKPFSETIFLEEDEGHTTDEFRSPPIKAMRLAPESQDDSFTELLAKEEGWFERACKRLNVADLQKQDTKKTDEENTHECTQNLRSHQKTIVKDTDIMHPASVLLDTDASTKTEDENKWSCSVCTFLNHVALPYCEMCSSANVLKGSRHKNKLMNSIQETNSSYKEGNYIKKTCNTKSVHKDSIMVTNHDLNNLEFRTSKESKNQNGDSNKSTYKHAKKTVKIHDISDSENEISETESESINTDTCISCQENLATQSPLKSSKRRFVFSHRPQISPTDDSHKSYSEHVDSAQSSPSSASSAIGSIEVFSEGSQSNINTSKDSVDIEEHPDTGDEERLNADGTMNESGMEADDEVTIIEEESSERSPSNKALSEEKAATVECTPTRQTILQKEENITTPSQTEEEIIQQESIIAMRLFSPGFKKASELAVGQPWVCEECYMTNEPRNDDCDGCLAERPIVSANDNQSAKHENITCHNFEENRWKCQQCHINNDSQSNTCSECFTTKSQSLKVLPSGQSWTCKECDWENTRIAEGKCEMCCSQRKTGDAKRGSMLNGCQTWACKECNFENFTNDNKCVQCSTSIRGSPKKEEPRVVNIDEVPVYKQFQFSCSMNTARVYLYDEKGESLNVNFLPIDVQMDSYGELPELLLHPENFKHVKRFVREWNSLTATKKRIIVKSGAIFTNPCLLYQGLRAGKKPSKERYTSKSTGAKAAVTKAKEIGGSIRVLTRPIYEAVKGKSRKGSKESASSAASLQHHNLKNVEEDDRGEYLVLHDKQFLDTMKGIVQAMDKDGNPLCIHCQAAYQNHLVSKETIKDHPWFTRFCSKKCIDEYWMTHHRGYSRQQVFEAERGICQKCNFDCQGFFERIRITKDLRKRAKLIQESHYGILKAEVKEKMAKTPQIGMFWQADHIVPVAHGGGECDIDNLRTLCTVCHRSFTAEQHRNRAAMKRLEAAAFHTDITSFFQPITKQK